MATYYHSNGGGKNTNKKDNNDWWGWLPIVILFCFPTPVTWIIAFFLLIDKVKKGRQKQKNVRRHPYDLRQEQERQSQATWDGQSSQARPGASAGGGQQQSGSARSSAGASARVRDSGKKKPAEKKKGNGTGLIIAGAIVAAVFGMSAIGTFLEALSWGGLIYELTGIFTLLVFMGGGFGMLGIGLGKKRRLERYMGYLGYIGANREVPLANMAAAFDVSVKKLCKDLRRMLADGVLPAGYLDLAEGKLYLTEMGYRAPKREEKKPEPQAEKTAAQDEDAILREIRQVNDDIPDEEMSAKIDRIEEITRKILAYQKQHPERAGQLRSFLNYYLPTTLKILRAYAQLDAQGIEGENITAAKGRIEGMMDQVVAGFEKQLDKLFHDDAMDIATDVKVLEDMLKKDGLSGGEGMTMTL